MIKIHNKDFFYKYTSPTCVLKILESGTFRWSSPLLFNDPFDHQFSIHFNVEPEQIKDRFLNLTEEFVYGKNEPEIVTQTPFAFALQMLRKNRLTITKQQFLDEMREGFDEGALNMRESLRKINEFWNQIVRHARIFCVAEENDNLKNMGDVVEFVE